MTSEQPTHWRQRSARAHRFSYQIEQLVRWLGVAGAFLALVAVLAKLWWP